MGAPTSCAVPAPRHIDAALHNSGVLQGLRERLKASDGRLTSITGHLPGQLAAHVRAGPLDDEGWSLIAANASVAAKLRQLAPRLIQVLAESGWPARSLRIKVEGGR